MKRVTPGVQNVIKQKIKIVGVTEVLGLTPGELAGWNILSIRGRFNQAPLRFPGARRTKTLHFDDVEEDSPDDGQYAATPEDIRAALDFSREIRDEPLLIHCAAGISRSTAITWLVVYDKMKETGEDAVRRSFNIVRRLRPILSPNRHVLRLGIEAMVPGESREAILQQFGLCLMELGRQRPV